MEKLLSLVNKIPYSLQPYIPGLEAKNLVFICTTRTTGTFKRLRDVLSSLPP